MEFVNRAPQFIYSNYFVTINTNQNIAANDQAAVALRNALDRVISRRSIFTWLVYFDGQNEHPFTTAAQRRLVTRIRGRCGFEQQGQQNRNFHAHILLEITHQTNIRIDYDAFREELAQYLPAAWRNNINVNFRLMTNPEDLTWTLRYILKDGIDMNAAVPHGLRGLREAMANPGVGTMRGEPVIRDNLNRHNPPRVPRRRGRGRYAPDPGDDEALAHQYDN